MRVWVVMARRGLGGTAHPEGGVVAGVFAKEDDARRYVTGMEGVLTDRERLAGSAFRFTVEDYDVKESLED